MREERTLFFKSKAKSIKTHEELLSLSGNALRHVINSALRTIKSTTVELIVGTTIELLSDKDGSFLKPLADDLPKSLRDLFGYQPHVERMSQDCWDRMVAFCLESLSHIFSAEEGNEAEEEVQDSWSTAISSRARTPFESTDGAPRPSLRESDSAPRATPRASSSRDKRYSDEQIHAAEDMVQCLRLLVTASNAPVVASAEAICNTLIVFLHKQFGRGNAAALAAINAILPRIIFSKSQLSEQIIRELLPMMKSFWGDIVMRDEILTTLTYTEAHIRRLLIHDRDDALSIDLEAFVEAVYSDYRRRKESTAHQFLEEEYLCFRRIDGVVTDPHPLSMHAFAMDGENVRCESLWATVATIARFSAMLDERKRRIAHNEGSGDGLATKRLRITHHFQEYLRHVSEPRSNAKRAALQVLAFVVQETPLDEEQIQNLLEKLTGCMSDENSVHASWAMITLAAYVTPSSRLITTDSNRTAFQKTATRPPLKPFWSSVWKSASRAVTSVSTCRAACHLMDMLLRLEIIPFSTITADAQSMVFSVELNGPALLTETSVAFMTTIIQERVRENPTNLDATAERVLNWLFGKWAPRKYPASLTKYPLTIAIDVWAERTSLYLNAHHCDAHDILSLLHTCLDIPFTPLKVSSFQTLGSIAQAHSRTAGLAKLSSYLLLLKQPDNFKKLPINRLDTANSTPSSHAVQLEGRISDFCISELERTKCRWKDMAQQNPQGITSNMWRVMTNFCIVVTALSALFESSGRPVAALKTGADGVAQALANLLARPQTESYKMETVLEACARSLPDLSFFSAFSRTIFNEAGVSSLAIHLRRALDIRQDNKKQPLHAEDVDFMDIDEDPESQNSNGISAPEFDVPRHDAEAYGEAAALHASCASYIHLIAAATDVPEEDQDTVPEEFVEHLICKSQADLLRSRPLVQALLCSHIRISTSDGLKILERLMEALIDPAAREYNTSEVANSMMVESLIGLTKTWDPSGTDHDSQDFKEQTKALYEYYTVDMEESGVRVSPTLQIRIADFLHGMLRFDYLSDNPRSPSVRTRLFQLLSQGEMAVKYHIAQGLPAVFELWALPTHDDILQDVDSHLPEESNDLEGIAIRLFVLSKLASRWHTLLRQCIYRIFATAGLVTAAAQHANYCISEIAQAKGAGDSKLLFRLFAPQIIFTWLDRKQGLADIPYSIFGYDSLGRLLGEIESEAVAQAVMLGHEKEVKCIADHLSVDIPELLLRNISKAAAYTISWDTCRGSARNKNLPSNEQLLCKLISSENNGHASSKSNNKSGPSTAAKHISLDQNSFPRALGHVFQTMDYEERIKKSLEKRNMSDPALQALTKMLNNSHSSMEFSVGIEPSFSAFYLPDQIDRLCRRAFGTITNFWNATTYTLVIRMLLDRVRPALGSLYARSVIRKIRVVVALAGPVAYEGYPLQMTLQSLRPFLTDIQCAQDVIGIIQYLFENGAQYLTENLSFLTGIGLSTLVSLRSFLGSSQEVMTQQTQYSASMDATKAFHTWLTQQFKEYAEIVTVSDKSSIKAFRLITTAASQVRLQGNSIRGSEESKLLLEILDDVKSDRNLLNTTSRDVALNLLCQDFLPAETAMDDVLGDDIEAAEYAPYVWDSCQRPNVGDGYLRWAARVLGRTFSACGTVKRSTIHSSPWSNQDLATKDILGRGSREAIVQSILDILYSDNRSDVSLAEDALRSIISSLDLFRRDEADEVVRNIPEYLREALKLDFAHLPTPQSTDASLEEVAAPTTYTKEASEWIKELAVALCSAALDDPVLKALPKLLTGIDLMASKTFPYILHLVLLKEFDGDKSIQQIMSDATMAWFSKCDSTHVSYMRSLHEAILYLRSQPVPKEVTRVDRDKWLEIDFLQAAEAATVCGMHRTALLFAETYSGTPAVKSATRRSSVLKDPPKLPVKLQLAIYKNLDEPDSFYGVDQGSGLSSAIERFDYEGDGLKSMLFRGARFGSQMRRSNALDSADSRGFISSLIKLNMDSVANALLSTEQLRDTGDEAVDYALHTARKLGKWDIKAPELNHSESSTLFKAFQGLNYAASEAKAQESIDSQLLATMNFLSSRTDSPSLTKIRLRTLAALTEADELVRCGRPEQLLDAWDRMKGRERWMRTGE